MKTKNPVKSTVTNFVTATRWKTRRKKTRQSMKDFFESLEGRGPIYPNSMFENFTRKVRKDMECYGTWISGEMDDFDFVAEYVSRLFRLYNDYMSAIGKTEGILNIEKGKVVGFKKHLLDFRKIYLKIRVWGRRTKRFTLVKWPMGQYPVQFEYRWPMLKPFDFRSRFLEKKPTFRYFINRYDFNSKKPVFYERQEFPKGSDS